MQCQLTRYPQWIVGSDFHRSSLTKQQQLLQAHTQTEESTGWAVGQQRAVLVLDPMRRTETAVSCFFSTHMFRVWVRNRAFAERRKSAFLQLPLRFIIVVSIKRIVVCSYIIIVQVCRNPTPFLTEPRQQSNVPFFPVQGQGVANCHNIFPKQLALFRCQSYEDAVHRLRYFEARTLAWCMVHGGFIHFLQNV